MFDINHIHLQAITPRNDAIDVIYVYINYVAY